LDRYYLGVDGGQSSTTALIARGDGQVIGSGRSGPCNHVSGSERRDKFVAVLSDCLRQATSGVDFTAEAVEFAAACLGFSGGAEDKAEFADEVVHSRLLKVTHDAEIALIGATGGEPGIIAIAGTGSIAFGRNANGSMARAGGWGYIFGDEGGAFDIVRRALRAALQFEEGWGPATALHALLLSKTGAESANQLMHRFYAEGQRREVAELASIVTEAAETGDPTAKRILAQAGELLSWYVEGVHRRLFAANEPVTVAHVGGAFRSAPLRHAFADNVMHRIRRHVIAPKYSPAAGALIEALRLDGNASKPSGVPETKT